MKRPEEPLPLLYLQKGFMSQFIRINHVVQMDARGMRAVPTATPYTGPLDSLTAEDFEFFQTRYGIVTPQDRIGRGIDFMYALPIDDPQGSRRGVVLRAAYNGSPLDGERYSKYPPGKKALTYMDKVAPVQAFYKGHGGAWNDALVIVEDQLSAMKVAETGLSSVALLGVPGEGEIGMDRLRELTAYKASEVIVALDADATENAFKFARKWGSAFKSLRVAILDRDLKDTPKANIFGVLGL